MSKTRDTAQTDAQTAQNAATIAANDAFIETADSQIDQAVALGVFWTTCRCVDLDVDAHVVAEYYANLGYVVTFLDIDNQVRPWFSGCWWILPNKPFRMKISWH